MKVEGARGKTEKKDSSGTIGSALRWKGRAARCRIDVEHVVRRVVDFLGGAIMVVLRNSFRKGSFGLEVYLNDYRR